MEDKGRKIVFTTEDGENVAFYVLEQTKLNGNNYLLVADSLEEEVEANALILKDNSLEGAADAIYEVVENETELIALSKVFEETIGDINIEMN